MTTLHDPEIIKISTEDILKSFKSHIEDTKNHRILFSGKFGSGKTTFLKEYIEINKKNYNVIHLYPVNYQVAKNEDIFELLKYDILSELVGEYGLSDVEEFSALLTFQNYLLNEGGKYLMDFMKALPKLGKYVKGGENIVKFVEGLHEIKGTERSEGSLIKTFVSVIESQSGNLYEFDVYSQMICSKIQDLKLTNPDKENVLLIDDLDRVDPNHLFRLLNVFSAHFDQQNFENDPKQNKFGFDKIIVVCDLHNVKNIFKSQFGIDTDCNGYIDKFYSKEVFWFENQINWIKTLQKFLNLSFKVNFIEGDEGNDYIAEIITDLIRNQAISPRKLILKKETPIVIPELQQDLWYRYNSDSASSTIIFRVYIFLMSFFENDFHELTEEIEKLIQIQTALFDNKIRGPERKVFNLSSYLLSPNSERTKNPSVFLNGYKFNFDVNLGRGKFTKDSNPESIYRMLILLMENVHSVLRQR
ncbi:P-loop NTPase fold protein [Marinifilum fragile]|uniref:P-loop NTPase fold protein n=1 Tax=Marinifilum fragile TaxID=570161 RepID=UPI002AA6F8B2|nr:P-loop NTPase fold protein [Marinifilum fragile]